MTVLMGLDARLRLARLYLRIDAREQQGDLPQFLAAAFAGGVDIISIRQPGANRSVQLAALEVARRAAAPHHCIVGVNDGPGLAGEFSADLLHLGQAAGSPADARRSLHPWALLGRSTHTPQQCDQAVADPEVDYFCAGPVWTSAPDPAYAPPGLDLIRHAARVAPVFDPASPPWFAIGGIDAGNLDQVLAAGARRICVTRAITGAADPEGAARELRDRLRQAWRQEPAAEAYAFQAVSGTARRR